jgi:HSP20 family protein
LKIYYNKNSYPQKPIIKEGKMSPESTKISKIFGEHGDQNDQTKDEEKSDWLSSEYEGQLALDAYQTQDAVIIKAPVAGVRPENLEVSIVDDTVTIKGERKQEEEISQDNYFAQECYWGTFSRQIALPPGCDTKKAIASLKHGVLTIKVPKEPKSKTRVLKISTELE